MTYPVYYHEHPDGVVWHGSPDGLRRVIDIKTARKYGLNPAIEDDWGWPGREANDKRMEEFRRVKPGKVQA